MIFREIQVSPVRFGGLVAIPFKMQRRADMRMDVGARPRGPRNSVRLLINAALIRAPLPYTMPKRSSSGGFGLHLLQRLVAEDSSPTG